jgi:hypothetical protein
VDEYRGTNDMSKSEPSRDDDSVWERVLLRKENALAALLSVFLVHSSCYTDRNTNTTGENNEGLE